MTAQPVDSTPPTQPARGSTSDSASTGIDQPTWHVLDEPAAVRFLPSGTPLALRWRGSIWQVIGEPTAWSTTNAWPPPTPHSSPTPTTALTPVGTSPSTTLGVPPNAHLDAPLGDSGSVVTTRFCRFQAQTRPASPVLEFDMSADRCAEDWRLRRVATVDGF